VGRDKYRFANHFAGSIDKLPLSLLSSKHQALPSREEGQYMARPIEATPVLKGKDAEVFLRQMNSAVMTPERQRWLESVAAESKRVEKNK
jgi:hypothetical protein